MQCYRQSLEQYHFKIFFSERCVRLLNYYLPAKIWLKVERLNSSLAKVQFVNLNLLITKRRENWTLWGSHFSVSWLFYLFMLSCGKEILPSGGRTKDLVRKIYCRPTDFFLFFLQVERTFIVRHVHQQIAFLARIIAYAWIQSVSK